MYNDDFDSYHDLNHLPGKFLMINRIILGVCMMACCISTRMRCLPSLRPFYLRLTVIGTIWFLSLPMLIFIANTLVPYHMRHRTVGVWGAILQTSGILLLSWLVTSHSTSYHKLSHLGSTRDNLTESLSSMSGGRGESKMWIFGKTKVRLDWYYSLLEALRIVQWSCFCEWSRKAFWRRLFSPVILCTSRMSNASTSSWRVNNWRHTSRAALSLYFQAIRICSSKHIQTLNMIRKYGFDVRTGSSSETHTHLKNIISHIRVRSVAYVEDHTRTK